MSTEDKPNVPPMPGAPSAGVIPPEGMRSTNPPPDPMQEHPESSDAAQASKPEPSTAQPSAPADPFSAQDDGRGQEEFNSEARISPRPDSQHTKQNYPVYLPLKDPWDEDAPTMTVPAETRDKLEAHMKSLTPAEQKEMEQGNQERFVRVMTGGAQETPDVGMYAETSEEREGASFEQVVMSENRPLGVTRPKLGDDDKILRGDAAVLRMRMQMGLGGTYRIPLWHSGFWITIQTPGDDALLELDRKLSTEKISLGRATRGLLYSNSSVFVVNYLSQFILQHMVASTLKNEQDIESKIMIHDIQTLAWGMACAVWPNGFQYARAIPGKTVAENRVVEGLINVSKIQWTDVTALTPAQIKHMSSVTSNSMSDEAIKTYQDGFSRNGDRRITLENDVYVNIGVPSLKQHIESGMKWVNGIALMTDKAFGMEQDPRERNTYIFNQGLASMLRQYAHWVKTIDMGKNSAEDGDTIDSMLSSLSAHDDSRAKLMNEVVQYAEDTTISYIGVPSATESEENHFPRAPHILPIDALSTFFTLLNQKVPQILRRQ